MSMSSSMHEDIELIFQCGDSLQPLPTDEDNNSDITSASFALASDSQPVNSIQEEGGIPDATVAFGMSSPELDAIFNNDFPPYHVNVTSLIETDQSAQGPRAHSSLAMRNPHATTTASPMPLAEGKNLAASIIDIAEALKQSAVEQADHEEQLKGRIDSQKAEIKKLEAEVDAQKAEIAAQKAVVGAQKAEIKELKAEIDAEKAEIKELKAKIDAQKAVVDAQKAENGQLNAELREKDKALKASLEMFETDKDTSGTTTSKGGHFINGAVTMAAFAAAILIYLISVIAVSAAFSEAGRVIIFTAESILVICKIQSLLMLGVKGFNKKPAKGKKP